MLCSVFLQRLRWSAYWRMDYWSSRFAYSDANGDSDSYSNTYAYGQPVANLNFYADTNAGALQRRTANRRQYCAGHGR